MDPKQPLKGLVRKDGDTVLTLMADGSVRAIRSTVDPAELLPRAFDPADGNAGNLDGPPQAGPALMKAPFETTKRPQADRGSRFTPSTTRPDSSRRPTSATRPASRF